jgi:small-conductance mechanosensitive channel
MPGMFDLAGLVFGSTLLQIPLEIPLAQRFREEFLNVDLLIRLIQVGIVLVVAYAAYRLGRVLLARLEREVHEEDPLAKRIREQRNRTLASVLHSVLVVVIVIMTLLTVLDVFRVPIRPFLATIGILGLAISFGAQSLVKDIINGVFLLVEGQYGVGDVIRVGDTAGMVEKITIRSTTLRDVQGVVHAIPNGEITKVSNLTKGWSRAVLEIGVAYKEDIDRVMDVLRDIGVGMYADSEWSGVLLEEPTVPGVEQFADSGVIVRMMAKTLPLKQWDVARELRRRIKRRFDDEGIEIPFPHVTFYWGDGQAPGAAGHGSVLEPQPHGTRDVHEAAFPRSRS